MKKNLTRVCDKLIGMHDGIRGEVNIRGDVSNIQGDVSNIWGNIDDCELTDEERKRGIDINELIGK